MSLLGRDTPRPLQPPVAQRDIEAEVIHCVGGVISPLLLNIVLHGMGTAAGDKEDGTERQRWVACAPAFIRYADDFVVLCTTREEAEQVKERLAAWLEPKGLAFNEDKTRIVHLDEGFDFLGFNVRRYDGKLLIKPSTAAVQKVRDKVRDTVKRMRAATCDDVIRALNPLIKGSPGAASLLHDVA